MPILPTSPTGPTPGGAAVSRAQGVAGYTAELTNAYGAPVGESYQAYADSHMNMSALAALQAWAGSVAAGFGPALAKAISGFAKEAGKASGQIAIGTGLGAAAASKDILGGFNLGSWFLRIGEILIGLVLIGVGLAKITNAVPIATKIASVVK